MAAYVISDVAVHDEAAMHEYLQRAPATIARHGGRYLARRGAARRGAIDVLEGDWHPSGVVIVEFATLAAARAWYDSPDYRELRERCFTGAARDMIAVDGIAQ